MKTVTENWRPVAGFEGQYEVSDLGRVRSLDREMPYETKRRGKVIRVIRRLRGAILKPGTMRSGHQVVILGRRNSRLVHRLVLEAFVGPAPPGTEACHGDGDPANNALPNLRWDTRAANIQDAIRHGNPPGHWGRARRLAA